MRGERMWEMVMGPVGQKHGLVGHAHLAGHGARVSELLLAGLLDHLTWLLGSSRSSQQVGGGQHLGELSMSIRVPGTEVDHLAVVHDGNLVALGQELDLVSDENHGLVGHQATHAASEDVLGSVVVDSGQGIVQEHHLQAGSENGKTRGRSGGSGGRITYGAHEHAS